MQKIAVICCGNYGKDVVQIAAYSGFHVKVFDVEGLKPNENREDVQSIQGIIKRTTEHIHYTKNYEDLRDCNIIIEAIGEDLEQKRKVLNDISYVATESAIFVSTTETISVNLLATSTRRSDRFLGIHFCKPIMDVKLVELIRGIDTSDDTYREVYSLCESMGKIPIDAPDSPGFIVNRLLSVMFNEAGYLLLQGVKRDDIDTAMKYGCSLSLGPFEACDTIGLDVLLNVMTLISRGFGENKYGPNPVLKRLVSGGMLGKKSGCGFYDYKIENSKEKI